MSIESIQEALAQADRVLAGEKPTLPEAIDTKINLCDSCTLRNDYPICCPPDIAFGDGKGNDNIIQCSNHIKGQAKPCSIPLNTLITPEQDSEATNYSKMAEESTYLNEPVDYSHPAFSPDPNAWRTGDEEVRTIEPETTAIVLRPGEDIEAHGYFAESMKMLEDAEARVIKTLEDAKAATDDLSLISKLKKAMEAKRKEKLAPSDAEAKAIRDTYNYLMVPVLEAEKITKAKQTAFLQEQQRIRREQEEINRKRMEAAQAEMKLKGELSEPVGLVEVHFVPERIRSDMGTSGLTDHWVFQVDDFTLVPDTYKVIDSVLLNAVANRYHASNPVPGITFVNQPYLATRSR